MSTIYIEDRLSEPHFSHAWRGKNGSAYADVLLGASFVIFDSAAEARAAAAACTQAADALDAFPPAPEEGQQ